MDSHETLVLPGGPHGSSKDSTALTAVSPSTGVRPKLVLGRYRILALLGSGGFGVVWRAHDQQLDREVAVKRIALPPVADGTADERAEREALAAARLAHPAIVALYEARAVPEEDAFYLVSELVRGETLAELIAADTLADEQVLEIGLALGAALEHAHERGVIHRDVKPHNVLVPHDPGEYGEPAKLTDFGGAWLAGEEGLTRTGDVLGTLAYMAPEQSEGREVGESADLYSLALVLYEALSGINPVRGPTPAATARRIGRLQPPLQRSRPDLPRGLTRALDRALAPEPEDRGALTDLRVELQAASTGGLEHRRARSVRRAPRVPAALAAPPMLDPARNADPAPELAPLAPLQRVCRLACAVPAGALAGMCCAWLGTAAPVPPGLAASLVVLLVAALPRLGWMLAAAAVIVWQLLAGRSGTALIVLAAVLPVAPLLRRPGPEWSAAVLAPVLGLAGLAAAFPALAGQALRWRARAALGALGYWWLLLAEPLLSRRLWLGQPSGVSPRHQWEGSIGETAVHVLGPLLGPGLILGAALWAVAALVLPWIVRGHSAALDAVVVTVWSAALIAAAPVLDRGLSAATTVHGPNGAVLGALSGGLLVLLIRALRGPVPRPSH